MRSSRNHAICGSRLPEAPKFGAKKAKKLAMLMNLLAVGKYSKVHLSLLIRFPMPNNIGHFFSKCFFPDKTTPPSGSLVTTTVNDLSAPSHHELPTIRPRSDNHAMELQIRSSLNDTVNRATSYANSSSRPTNISAGNNVRMKPRRSTKPPSEYVCQNVPHLCQPLGMMNCWHAAFNMVNGRHTGEASDYSDTPELYNDGKFGPIPRGRLKYVLDKEQLSPITRCGDLDHEYSAQELKAILEEDENQNGQIAFAWRPECSPFIRRHPDRYHWSVIVDADPVTNMISYLDPVERTYPKMAGTLLQYKMRKMLGSSWMEKKPEADMMTIDEFNRQRVRDHDHTMVRRAPSGETRPTTITWRSPSSSHAPATSSHEKPASRSAVPAIAAQR